MNESEFVRVATGVLDRIEALFDAIDAEVDLERKGTGLLSLEFENGTQIILNLQTPMRQLWIAAKAGGFHFEKKGARWVDTRSGEELFAALSKHASAQSGETITLTH